MKKILVPTDFSPVADNALKYAIEIATEFKSELVLYHVYSINKVDYDLDFPEDEQPYKKHVERRMYLTKLKFLDNFTQKGLNVQTKVDPDSIYSLCNKKVMSHGVDLVVPPEYEFRRLGHIVLAIDNRKVAPSVLLPLRKLALKFGAKVTLLNVNTGSNQFIYRKKDLYLDGVKTTYQEVSMSNNVNESINEFIEKVGCDLLCMIRREKGFFENVLKKSITKAQIYNSRTPLLVLPENSMK